MRRDDRFKIGSVNYITKEVCLSSVKKKKLGHKLKKKICELVMKSYPQVFDHFKCLTVKIRSKN